jgi:hypothetical protein
MLCWQWNRAGTLSLEALSTDGHKTRLKSCTPRSIHFPNSFSREITYLALLAFHSGKGLLQMQIFTVVPGSCLKHQSTYDIHVCFIQIILPLLVFIIDERLSVRV